MTQWHLHSERLASGARRTTRRRSDKKLAWKGSNPTEPVTAKEDERITVKALGNASKVKQRKVRHASIHDPQSKKTVKAEVTRVVQNAANRLYTRRNIVTKGALIEVKMGTELKQAIVTSRPGQSGTVHARLVESMKQAA